MRRRRQRGSTFVEFVLVGIPAIFLLVATVEVGLAMWNYHTLARAVDAGARLAALRGSGCSITGNSCGVTVGNIETAIANAGLGLTPSHLTIKLKTNSGATTTCNPISSCAGSSTSWPPSSNGDNAEGAAVTVSAVYSFPTALSMVWPSRGTVQIGTFYLPAQSRQLILF